MVKNIQKNLMNMTRYDMINEMRRLFLSVTFVNSFSYFFFRSQRLAFGRANGNVKEARRLYVDTHPNREVPPICVFVRLH